MPWFDVRFRGYGRNKIVFTAALNASGFTFEVPPPLFTQQCLLTCPHQPAALPLSPQNSPPAAPIRELSVHSGPHGVMQGARVHILAKPVSCSTKPVICRKTGSQA